MEKVKAQIFLVLVLWVQFGSTGFVYYENVCSGSESTSISFKDVGCCCGPKDVVCSSKPKDCDGFSSKCCDSHQYFQQTSDDFPNSEFQFELAIVSLPKLSNFVLAQNQFPQEAIDGFYPCHSPPIRNIDTRIFIQSFQI